MGKTELVIRSFQDSDEPAVARLWKLCFPGDPPRNRPADVIRRKRQVQPELFLVGFHDAQLVATAIGGYDGYRGWVYHVATDPAFRRLGFGRQIMAEVERRLRAMGCPKLNLQVRATNNEVVAFYRSLGYSQEERVSMGKLLAEDVG
jgi:ribosomal protein S18 acetylase RimI-like enzyme